MGPGSRFQFGEFTLEVGTRQLLEAGRATHLSPKAFDLLHVLLDRRPQVVAKKELNDRLWPDTFVSDVNLAALVAELRRALRDDAARPRFIRTVHRHGYAFSGPATVQPLGAAAEAEAFSTHWVVWDGGQVRLATGDNILGRGRRVTVWLDSPSISRRHARIVVTGTDAAVEDLGSRNGTYVQGVKVTTPTRLSDGDEIRLGSVMLTYRLNSGQETTISTPT
jgi:DNA-binding winged helix-turn-helix (wHTH) protein